jgi:hypothetical protein
VTVSLTLFALRRVRGLMQIFDNYFGVKERGYLEDTPVKIPCF